MTENITVTRNKGLNTLNRYKTENSEVSFSILAEREKRSYTTKKAIGICKPEQDIGLIYEVKKNSIHILF
jgi:hypothetical protein